MSWHCQHCRAKSNGIFWLDTGREGVFLKEREKPLPRKQKMILVEPHTILILEGAKYED